MIATDFVAALRAAAPYAHAHHGRVFVIAFGGEAAEQPADQPPPEEQGGEAQPQEQQQGTRQVSGSDRTGVTDDSITVAFHAPVTGAAPLPAESFREARDLYWRWQAEEKGRTFLGRSSVEVLFQDDKYDPANAQQVCQQLAAEAFMVAGGGGTDQIQACGQLAGVRSFPYFSAGVTEAGLQDNPWYFASSMTYRQQGVLLAEYIAANHPDQKFATVVTQTANFDDAVQGFATGVEAAGIQGNYVAQLRHPKGDNSWYNSYAQELDGKGVEVVYILTSPVDYIQFAQQAAQSGYGPFDFVGVGVSKGLNAVLASGCPSVGGGVFFSPFPGLDWARDNVPEFFQASAKFGTVPDDLALALWGINKQLDQMFQKYEQTFGTDLTREDFRALVEGAGPYSTGIFPDIAFSPDNHFGGQSVHVLRANCDERNPESGDFEHQTVATFATGF